MPWTLYRHLAWELVKLMTLTTAIMCMVISFGMAIKPLTEGGLGAGSLLRFVVLVIPVTMQFAIPFAAAFASTIVFNRMVNDNEILACSASGMSYQTVLMPMIAIGLALTLGMMTLSNTIVPKLYRSAMNLIERDFMNLLVGRLERRESAQFGDWVIYADAVDTSSDPPMLENSAVQPKQLVMLEGVAVGRLDNGLIVSATTAQRADLLVFDYLGESWITIRMTGGHGYTAGSGGQVQVRSGSVDPMRLGGRIHDHPRLYTWQQMRDLAVTPEQYFAVNKPKEQLITACATEHLLKDIVDSLLSGQLQLTGGDHVYRIHAPSVERTENILTLNATDDGLVDVEVYQINDDGEKYIRHMTAQSATLRVVDGEAGKEPWVEPSLIDVRVKEANGDLPANQSRQISLRPSRWAKTIRANYAELNVESLLNQANQLPPSEPIDKSIAYLHNQIERMARRIMAQMHMRASHSVSCLVVILLGALLSLRYRGRMPLAVYFWSFMLTMMIMISTLSGETLLKELKLDPGVGITMVWTGNVVVIMIITHAWWLVRRN